MMFVFPEGLPAPGYHANRGLGLPKTSPKLGAKSPLSTSSSNFRSRKSKSRVRLAFPLGEIEFSRKRWKRAPAARVPILDPTPRIATRIRTHPARLQMPTNLLKLRGVSVGSVRSGGYVAAAHWCLRVPRSKGMSPRASWGRVSGSSTVGRTRGSRESGLGSAKVTRRSTRCAKPARSGSN